MINNVHTKVPVSDQTFSSWQIKKKTFKNINLNLLKIFKHWINNGASWTHLVLKHFGSKFVFHVLFMIRNTL